VSTAIATAVQLDWSIEEGMVTITPRNEDRFSIQMRRAVEILQQSERRDKVQSQFHLLFKELGRWVNDQGGIHSAIVTQRDGSIAFVVVRSKKSYDEDFEDSLSELDFRIANDPDLDLLTLDMLSLPRVSDEALRSFLDPHFSIELAHGN